MKQMSALSFTRSALVAGLGLLASACADRSLVAPEPASDGLVPGGASRELSSTGITVRLLGGSFAYSVASGIGSTGLVTGDVYRNGTTQPFAWSSSSGFTLIPILSGFTAEHGLGINSGNEVVGFAQSSGYNNTKAGFVWTASQGAKVIANGAFLANAVNDNGVVAGSWRSSSSSYPVPATWTPGGGVRVIGVLPGGYTGEATKINGAGQVVGWSNTASGNRHAFLWSASTGMRDLGTLSGDVDSFARGINSQGMVVGESKSWSRTHAFVWTSSTGMRGLPGLGITDEETHAFGVDAKGRVTGVSNHYAQTYANIAVYWLPGVAARRLSLPSGAQAGTVTGMNDAGQVSGHVLLSDSNQHAVIWTLP